MDNYQVSYKKWHVKGNRFILCYTEDHHETRTKIHNSRINVI